jgi:group I intron endonuclease
VITYLAINTVNGRFYSGSTKDFESRRGQHLRCKKNHPFHNALRKNPEAFIWETFEDDSNDPVLEQSLLDMWFGKECCYNLNPLAGRPPSLRGHKFSEKTLQKRSESRKGRPVPSLRGRCLTEEHKRKISAGHIGKVGLKGDNNPCTKLTEKQREEIRERYVPQGKGRGKGNASVLAKEYGVSRKTIHVIVNEGKTN